MGGTQGDLECLTELFPSATVALNEAEGDEGGGDVVEGQTDIGAALVANDEAAEAGEPRECALGDPAIPTEAFARFNAAPGDAGNDAPSAQGPATTSEIVSLISVELGGTTPGAARALADRRDGIDNRFQHRAVVAVGGR